MAHKIMNLRRCEFEVFGKVQGVFFRKYAANFAKENGLVGWVMNTEKGTVCGIFEGNTDAVNLFKNWLSKTGSPKSRIERLEIKSEKPIDTRQFSDFTIRR
ncbi:Acylphosphatase [Fasciola gigantica]|uniref:Acylphosphatase n=1 Tax=Fasciola gigantica TaxID=46835 RepID=A0A504YE83_FASGI|nr:Acylphosphatase [Fasciola gigantica]